MDPFAIVYILVGIIAFFVGGYVAAKEFDDPFIIGMMAIAAGFIWPFFVIACVVWGLGWCLQRLPKIR